MSANEIVTTATSSEVTLSVVMVTVLILLVVCNLFMYTVTRMLTDPKFCLRQMVQRYTQKVPRVRVLEVHPKPRTPSLIGHSHADLISLLSHSANLQLEGIPRETAYSPTLQLESATREIIHSSLLHDDGITREITPGYTKDDTWEAANTNMAIKCEMQKVEFIQEDVKKQAMSDTNVTTDTQSITDNNLNVPSSRKHKEIEQPVEEKKLKENGQKTTHTVPFSSKALNQNKDKVPARTANKDNRSISKGDNSMTTPYSDSMNLKTDKRTPATAKVGGVRPGKQISGQNKAAMSNSVVTQEHATNVKQENVVNGKGENEGHTAGDVLIMTSVPVVQDAGINNLSNTVRCQETVPVDTPLRSEPEPVSNNEPEITNGSNIGNERVPGSDINHGTISGPNIGPEIPTGSSSGPGTPTGPKVRPGTPTGPNIRPGTPTNPSTGPATPHGPKVRPATPTGPKVRPATPTGPSSGPGTPTGPKVRPALPTGPKVRPATPTGPKVRPATPTCPSTGPGTPTGPKVRPGTPTGPNIRPGTPTNPSNGPGTTSRSDSEIGQIILTNTYDTPVIKFFKEMKSEIIEAPEETTIIKGQVIRESEGMDGQTNEQVGQKQEGNQNLSEANNYSRENRNTDLEAEIKRGQIVIENGTDEQVVKEICSTSENSEREIQDQQVYNGQTDEEISNRKEAKVQNIVGTATGNQTTDAPGAADTKDSSKADKEGNTEGNQIKSGVEEQKGECDSYGGMNKISEETTEGDTSINTDIESDIETATNEKGQKKTEDSKEKEKVQLSGESDSGIKTEKERKEEEVFHKTDSKKITDGLQNKKDSKSSEESDVEKDLTEYIRSNTMETNDEVDDKVEDKVVQEKVGDNDKVSSRKDAKPTTNKSSKQEVVTTKSQAVKARNTASIRNSKRFKQLKLTH